MTFQVGFTFILVSTPSQIL